MDERLNRQAWIDAGLSKLAEEGPQSLKVMGIAQQLGVTKGSFYWHFSDLQAYKTEVLRAWESKYTLDVMQQANGVSSDARTKLHFLLRATFAQRSELGCAIRAWALTDEHVAQAQQRVDLGRISYVTELLREIGWPAEDAATLSRFLYYAVIGYSHTGWQAASEHDLALYLAMLVKVP
jgi:AcrR family transcriptional regulator